MQGGIKLKSVQEVREEYKICPNGHGKRNFAFTGWTVYCGGCDAHYDLEMRKF